MITIDQLLESVDLNFEPRWVTKDQIGLITIWADKPSKDFASNTWIEQTDFIVIHLIKLAEFENKHWSECIYEVPRKTSGNIKKLECYELADKEFNPTGKFEPMTFMELIGKINELVDAVNSLRDDCNLLMEYIAPENKCEPAENRNCAKNAQDPYNEQRKWMGCICRFWYDNPNDTLLDYLDKIQTGKNGVEYYSKESGDWFPHCEPVLPTDNAIYKGGDND